MVFCCIAILGIALLYFTILFVRQLLLRPPRDDDDDDVGDDDCDGRRRRRRIRNSQLRVPSRALSGNHALPVYGHTRLFIQYGGYITQFFPSDWYEISNTFIRNYMIPKSYQYELGNVFAIFIWGQWRVGIVGTERSQIIFNRHHCHKTTTTTFSTSATNTSTQQQQLKHDWPWSPPISLLGKLCFCFLPNDDITTTCFKYATKTPSKNLWIPDCMKRHFNNNSKETASVVTCETLRSILDEPLSYDNIIQYAPIFGWMAQSCLTNMQISTNSRADQQRKRSRQLQQDIRKPQHQIDVEMASSVADDDDGEIIGRIEMEDDKKNHGACKLRWELLRSYSLDIIDGPAILNRYPRNCSKRTPTNNTMLLQMERVKFGIDTIKLTFGPEYMYVWIMNEYGRAIMARKHIHSSLLRHISNVANAKPSSEEITTPYLFQPMHTKGALPSIAESNYRRCRRRAYSVNELDEYMLNHDVHDTNRSNEYCHGRTGIANTIHEKVRIINIDRGSTTDRTRQGNMMTRLASTVCPSTSNVPTPFHPRTRCRSQSESDTSFFRPKPTDSMRDAINKNHLLLDEVDSFDDVIKTNDACTSNSIWDSDNHPLLDEGDSSDEVDSFEDVIETNDVFGDTQAHRPQDKTSILPRTFILPKSSTKGENSNMTRATYSGSKSTDNNAMRSILEQLLRRHVVHDRRTKRSLSPGETTDVSIMLWMMLDCSNVWTLLALNLLSLDHDACRLVQNEIDTLYALHGDEDIYSPVVLDRLYYLNALIYESIRLCPPFLGGLKTMSDTVDFPNDGVRVAKGSHIFFCQTTDEPFDINRAYGQRPELLGKDYPSPELYGFLPYDGLEVPLMVLQCKVMLLTILKTYTPFVEKKKRIFQRIIALTSNSSSSNYSDFKSSSTPVTTFKRDDTTTNDGTAALPTTGTDMTMMITPEYVSSLFITKVPFPELRDEILLQVRTRSMDTIVHV